jgi:FtsP/CotA-like multicopper oxidase with cupredoxin domain
MTNLIRMRFPAFVASLVLLFLAAASSPAQITHFAPAPEKTTTQGQFAELTAAAADPADAVCARFAVGAVVADPPSLSSSNGQLEVTFHFKQTTDQAGLTRYCYVYTDPSGNTQEAPSLHVNPGDQLIIHFYNDLSASSAANASGHAMHMKPADSSAAASDCSATSVSATSTNLHFHGTTVAPVCHQDEVLHTIVNAQQEFDYTVQIPADAEPGVYWYHPHAHGYSDPQVLGGAAGALIVDGIENVNNTVAGLPERVFVLRDQDLPASDAGGSSLPQTDLSINYVPVLYPAYTPAVIQTAPSEKQFWRVLNASADTLGLLVFLAAMVAIGCGGGGSPTPATTPGTTAGAYVFTVTGKDTATGNITASGTINVTVN